MFPKRLFFVLKKWIDMIVFISGAYFYRQSKIHQGKRNKIYFNVFIKYPENITIGNDNFINYNCLLWAAPKGKINIGNDVLLGPNVKIIASNHGTKKENLIRLNQWEDGDITIQDDVWIGANSVILKGVTIGRGSVVGAGSIVNKDIPPYTIYAGVPAKFIKDRK